MKKEMESGRSMVEMLGVLAIVGVLSIGGIAGYTAAMNQGRANAVVDDVNFLYVNAVTTNKNQQSYVASDFFSSTLFPSVVRVGTHACEDGSICVWEVEVSDVPQKVCLKVINMLPAFGGPEVCADENANTITIGFDGGGNYSKICTACGG